MSPQTQFSDFGKVLLQYPAAYQLNSTGFPQSHASGFSGASIWKIEAAAGPYALRAMAPDLLSRDRLSELHRLVAQTHSCGVVQVPVPIATSDGATFFDCDGLVWQLEPWMPGLADYSSDPRPPRLDAALVCLARWHLAAARFIPHSSGSTWFFSSPAGTSPGLAERLTKISSWNADACDRVRSGLDKLAWPQFASLGREILQRFQRLAPSVAARVQLGMRTAVPLQPCLRDVWHDHILFTGDEVTGLIDLHASRSDSVATDLARLLGSLLGDDHQRWEAGLEAYQRVRALSSEELTLLELFDQTSVLLSGMTWLGWYCLQGRMFSDRERIISRLQGIVERMGHLAAK